jgi:polyferredoxin
MNDVQIVGYGLLVIVALNIWSLIKGYRNKRFKYELKNSINQIALPIGMIVLGYMLIGGISVLPMIQEWCDAKSLTYEAYELWFIYQTLPLVYMIGLMVLVGRIYWFFINDPIKYSDQEKQWKKEERENNKVRQWLKSKFPKLIKS